MISGPFLNESYYKNEFSDLVGNVTVTRQTIGKGIADPRSLFLQNTHRDNSEPESAAEPKIPPT